MTRRTLLATAALLITLATGCSQTGGTGTTDRGSGEPASGPTPTSTATRANPGGSGTSPGGTTTNPATHAVAIYYVAPAGPAGMRLYREFHARPQTLGVIRDAVNTMLHERAYDPDYSSLWPSLAQVRGATKVGDLATVDLTAGPSRDTTLAVQQLVWTVTAADRTTTRVSVLVNGRAITAAPVRRAAASGVLGPVWVLSPVHGASVPRTFVASGEATVFEAVVSWALLRNGLVVGRGTAQATTGAPGRGTWQATITAAAPGAYQLVAFEASAKDGTAQFTDTKAITVR